MKWLMVLVVLAASGCSDDDGGGGNPDKLWLSLIGRDETRVQLVPQEPDPF